MNTTPTTAKFGKYEVNENDHYGEFRGLSKAHGKLEEAKNALFSEGDLDRMRLDAEGTEQLKQRIHSRLQRHAQDIADSAGHLRGNRHVGHVSSDDIYWEAMRLLSEQVQTWADRNDLDLDFA